MTRILLRLTVGVIGFLGTVPLSVGAQAVVEGTGPDGIPYTVTTPEGYSVDGPSAPLILFLHGGDRSNTRHHPARYAAESAIDFPFLVLAPHCTGGCSWGRTDIDGLLRDVVADYNVDESRIYLTGYSMGGIGAWDLLARSPGWFAAAAPIAGGGDPSEICAARDVAVRAYHSDDDAVIPYSRSVQMVEALSDCGRAELVTLRGVGHGSWVPTFKDPAFYSWLLEHEKGRPGRRP